MPLYKCQQLIHEELTGNIVTEPNSRKREFRPIIEVCNHEYDRICVPSAEGYAAILAYSWNIKFNVSW